LLQYGTFEPQLISYQGVRDAAEQAYNEIMQGADIQTTLDDLTQQANELQAELMEQYLPIIQTSEIDQARSQPGISTVSSANQAGCR
jgi:hypothetical protein